LGACTRVLRVGHLRVLLVMLLACQSRLLIKHIGEIYVLSAHILLFISFKWIQNMYKISTGIKVVYLKRCMC
jgi:hypothetical protein